MSYDVGEATEGLDNEAAPTSQFILQTFRRFTYVTARSTTLPLLHLRHKHFTYVTWKAAHVLYLLRNNCFIYAYFVCRTDKTMLLFFFNKEKLTTCFCYEYHNLVEKIPHGV